MPRLFRVFQHKFVAAGVIMQKPVIFKLCIKIYQINAPVKLEHQQSLSDAVPNHPWANSGFVFPTLHSKPKVSVTSKGHSAQGHPGARESLSSGLVSPGQIRARLLST